MDNYHVCRIAVAPIRKEPSDRSEIVSQILFGDRVTVLEKTEKWCLIVTKHDNYEGWMDYKQLQKITDLQFNDEQAYQYLTPAQLDNTVIASNGTKFYLSPGSTLPYFNNGNCFIGENEFKVTSKPFIPNKVDFTLNVEETAKFFLNTPYSWGGRTFFGIDCSGFVQAVYKLNGVSLKRDASQQAQDGDTVDFLAAAQLGDLAFFDNEEGKIIHVGIIMSDNYIIHASGKVRIDRLDHLGIYNAESNRHTHKLRVIKKYI